VKTKFIPFIASALATLVVMGLWWFEAAGFLNKLWSIEPVLSKGVIYFPLSVTLFLSFSVALYSSYRVSRNGVRPVLLWILLITSLLLALSIFLIRFTGVYMPIAPVFCSGLLAALFVHAYRIWRVDNLLTCEIESCIDDNGLTVKEQDFNASLALLELAYEVSEAVLFRIHEGSLQVVARKRRVDNQSELDQHAWRECTKLSDKAFGTRKAQFSEAGGLRRIAIPLTVSEEIAGVLLVQSTEEMNSSFLDSLAGQLAQKLYSTDRREVSISPLISSRSASQRVASLSLGLSPLVDLKLAKLATRDSSEGFASSHLDGKLSFVNPRMLQLAGLEPGSCSDLFSLLDSFSDGNFDDPRLTLKRVIKSGEDYSREIYFAEKNQTLSLNLSFIREHDKALGFTLRIDDITQIKEHERLRQEMFSLMSHELRTPITSINGFAELLSDDEDLPLEKREFLQIIRTECQRLSKMIEAFLSISRLEVSEKQSVKKVPVLLNNVVHDMVVHFSPVAKKKRIYLTEETGMRMPPVSADRSLIMKAIANLIDNAIKYSPEKTTVKVKTELEAEYVSVSVEDHGFGIPPESRDLIWEKFYRVSHNGTEKNGDSTGLGLSFVREVAELHGGNVSVESEVGRGSTFSFKVPRL
jgi:signal transduction histidine kinase